LYDAKDAVSAALRRIVPQAVAQFVVRLQRRVFTMDVQANEISLLDKPNKRRDRVLIQIPALLLAAIVISGAAWMCCGVTRFGRNVLVGPGYAGRIYIQGFSVNLTSGWKRTVSFGAFPGRGITLPDPVLAAGAALPPHWSADHESARQLQIEYRHQFGFIVLTEKWARGYRTPNGWFTWTPAQ